MCGKNIKKFDLIECKILAFKVKKQVFQHIVELDYLVLKLLKLNFLHYKFFSFKPLLWEIELRV